MNLKTGKLSKPKTGKNREIVKARASKPEQQSEKDNTWHCRKLLACGDTEPNPGPEKIKCKPKYPCGECGKAVKRNKDAILCAQCNIWSYAICLKLPKQSLNYYQLHPEIDWPCFLCSLPGLNDSFFSHNEQEVDSNFTADSSAAEKEQEDIRQLRLHYISFAGIEVRVGVVLRFIFKLIFSPLPRNSVVIH